MTTIAPSSSSAPATTVKIAAAGGSNGLTLAEARRRLAVNGPNAVADVAQHPLRRAVGKLWAPVPWMRISPIVDSRFGAS